MNRIIPDRFRFYWDLTSKIEYLFPIFEKHNQKMKSKMKWETAPVFFVGMLMLLVLTGLSGCFPKHTSDSTTHRWGPKTLQGRQFRAFVSHLRSLDEKERDVAIKQYMAAFPHSPVIEQDHIVHLYWYGKARRVLINGDLQSGWTVPDTMKSVPCGDNTFFYRTYTLPAEARVDYQFNIDSVDEADTRNPVKAPVGSGFHSQIAMPGFKSDPIMIFRPEVPHGTLDSLEFISRDRSIRPRQVKIYLPPGYKDLSGLPVLFVLDGLQAIEFMSYPVVLDNLIADKKIVPVVSVFIPPVARFAEHMGHAQQAFINTLCDELLPLINQRYKTTSLPEERAITGISNGGLVALLTVLTRPDVFRCGSGQSSSVTAKLNEEFRQYVRKGKNRPALWIYFDVGRYDMTIPIVKNRTFLRSNELLHRKLKKAGIPHVFHIINDGHSWANWRERTREILIFFFGTNSSLYSHDK